MGDKPAEKPRYGLATRQGESTSERLPCRVQACEGPIWNADLQGANLWNADLT